MKPGFNKGQGHDREMPPTRGHDLKLSTPAIYCTRKGMPPTRGHDLKLSGRMGSGVFSRCPPHGGTT